MRLLVRNLTRNTSEAELKTLFANYGTVQSCTLVLDKDTGISKGFGFVEMPKPGEAKSAMSLKFLRKTPWARQKVEPLYLRK